MSEESEKVLILTYNEKATKISCKKDDFLKDIFQNYSNMIDKNINEISFFYEKEKINPELTVEQLIPPKVETPIIVCLTSEYLTKKKTKNIICNKCDTDCVINFKDYKFDLLKCANNHTSNNLLLEEFEHSQYKPNKKITCSICYKENIITQAEDSHYYKCCTCNKYLCIDCKNLHSIDHNVIDIECLPFKCNKHNDERYNSYCNTCNKNLCTLCETEHEPDHEIIYYKEIITNKNCLKLNEFKEKVDLLNNEIREIINKLNTVIKNYEIYYGISEQILDGYDLKNRNYQSLKNVSNITSYNNYITKDIDRILKEKNINNKLKNIMVIYDKMTNKNYVSNVKNLEDSDKEININISINKMKSNHNEEKANEISNNINDSSILNEIKITYKLGDESKIKIFDNTFVNNNKNNCKIISNNNEYDLSEKISYKNIKIINNNEFEIKLTGFENITDMSYMFYNCKKLLNIQNFSNIDISKVTNLNSVFYGCESLQNIPDISNWNTTSVTNIGALFDGCNLLTSLPDISKWNTENITDMSYIFCNCKLLTSLPDISKWSTNKVTNMSDMFAGCQSLCSIPDISKWNTKCVTNIGNMFLKCSTLQFLPDISKWNIENVEIMSNIFGFCKGISYLPDISKWNTGKVSYMIGVFSECNSLNSLPDISKWNTSNVTNMRNMFFNCSALVSLPDISGWNVNNVSDTSYMFQGCDSNLNIPEIFKQH